MVDVMSILKRSWHILWNYRILWVFGLLLALTAGGGPSFNSSFSSNSSNTSGRSSTATWPPQISANSPEWVHEAVDGINQAIQWFDQNVIPVLLQPAQHLGVIVWVVLAFLLLCLLLSAVVALVRYPSETAVIRMVDEYERSGSKLKFGQGWKLGWTRRSFHMWLIDLIISIPVTLMVLLLLFLGASIYYNAISPVQIGHAVSMVAAVGLVFIILFVLVVFALLVGLLRNLIIRYTALEDCGVWESFSKGWTMFKKNWKSTGVMWLIMVGIGIIFGIASMILFFLLIPAYLVLFIPALIVAAIPALIALGIAHIFAGAFLTSIIVLLVALPFFFIVLFSPMLFVEGFYKIYSYSVWTLTFREMRILQDHIVSNPPNGTTI